MYLPWTDETGLRPIVYFFQGRGNNAKINRIISFLFHGTYIKLIPTILDEKLRSDIA